MKKGEGDICNHCISGIRIQPCYCCCYYYEQSFSGLYQNINNNREVASYSLSRSISSEHSAGLLDNNFLGIPSHVIITTRAVPNYSVYIYEKVPFFFYFYSIPTTSKFCNYYNYNIVAHVFEIMQVAYYYIHCRRK